MDASAVLAYILREDYPRVTEFFDSLDDGIDQLLGPHLLLAECTSAIHEQIEKGRIGADEVPAYIQDLLRIPIRTCEHRQQFTMATELARRFRHAKAYDMQYLAAAVAENVELVTIDGGMRQAALNIKHPVRFLR